MNLNNIKQKLANLMRGRYGMDALYRALTMVALVFFVLNLFIRFPLFYPLGLVCFGLAFFRAFSRNHARRSAENQQYLALKSRVKARLLLYKNRFRDRGTHRYRACPNCHKTLRLTRKIGVNHVKCPVCRHEFDINIRF